MELVVNHYVGSIRCTGHSWLESLDVGIYFSREDARCLCTYQGGRCAAHHHVRQIQYSSIRGALPYVALRACADKEWESLPHFVLTSDKYWDPTSLDCEGHEDNEEWVDTRSSFPDRPDSKLSNEHSQYSNITHVHEFHFSDAETYKEDTLDEVIDSFVSWNNITIKSNEPEYSLLQPLFNWLHINLV